MMGELIETAMEKVTVLNFFRTKVTKVGVAQLKKALPKCDISSNPKK